MKNFKAVSVILAVVSVLILVTNCTYSNNSSSTSQTAIVKKLFSDSVNEFIVRVVYETGAAPYTGLIGISGNDTWDITKTSYQSLFQNHIGRVITVPKTLATFSQIADQNKASWSASELILFGQSLAPANLITNNKATVTVIFVNGLFDGNSQVLGVHFTGYAFAFIFKDVVTSVGGTPIDQRYVEQGTVVHELGHVVGFVNNGVPLTTSYEDAAHPSHSTNSNCVMHWTVESSNSILGQLTNNILANRLNLFEAEVLTDSQAYHP